MRLKKALLLFALASLFAAPASAMPRLMYQKPGEVQAIGAPQFYFNWAQGYFYGMNGFPNMGQGTTVNLRNAGILQEAYSGASANTLFVRACGSGSLKKIATINQLRWQPGCGVFAEGGTNCTTGSCIGGLTGQTMDSTNWALHSRDMTQAVWANISGTPTKNRNQAGAGDSASNTATLVTATAANDKICQAISVPPMNATIQTAGTGYATGEVATMNDGCGTVGKIRIAAQSGGVPTTIAFSGSGAVVPKCSTIPSNPITQTSSTGSGTGLTVNYIWNKFNISMYMKRSAGSGAVSISADNSSYTDESGAINSSTFTWVKLAPATMPTNPQVCLKIATNTDAVIVDHMQAETSDMPAISPIVTGAATNQLGDEMPVFNVPSGSPVMQNAGYRVIEEIYQGRPMSMMIIYSGDFSPSLSHLIFGTDGSAATIPFVTGAAGGGVLAVSAPGGSFNSAGTDTSGFGTPNKALLSCYGGGCKICVNGTLTKDTSTHAQYTPAAGNLTHAGQLNNGSGLLPLNGYEYAWIGWFREVTDLECQLYTIANHSFLLQ